MNRDDKNLFRLLDSSIRKDDKPYDTMYLRVLRDGEATIRRYGMGAVNQPLWAGVDPVSEDDHTMTKPLGGVSRYRTIRILPFYLSSTLEALEISHHVRIGIGDHDGQELGHVPFDIQYGFLRGAYVDQTFTETPQSTGSGWAWQHLTHRVGLLSDMPSGWNFLYIQVKSRIPSEVRTEENWEEGPPSPIITTSNVDLSRSSKDSIGTASSIYGWGSPSTGPHGDDPDTTCSILVYQPSGTGGTVNLVQPVDHVRSITADRVRIDPWSTEITDRGADEVGLCPMTYGQWRSIGIKEIHKRTQRPVEPLRSITATDAHGLRQIRRDLDSDAGLNHPRLLSHGHTGYKKEQRGEMTDRGYWGTPVTNAVSESEDIQISARPSTSSVDRPRTFRGMILGIYAWPDRDSYGETYDDITSRGVVGDIAVNGGVIEQVPFVPLIRSSDEPMITWMRENLPFGGYEGAALESDIICTEGMLDLGYAATLDAGQKDVGSWENITAQVGPTEHEIIISVDPESLDWADDTDVDAMTSIDNPPRPDRQFTYLFLIGHSVYEGQNQ